MRPGECNSFTLTLLACLMVTPCVPTILTPAVLTFLLLYNLWFEHHSTDSPINQVYTVTLYLSPTVKLLVHIEWVYGRGRGGGGGVKIFLYKGPATVMP